MMTIISQETSKIYSYNDWNCEVLSLLNYRVKFENVDAGKPEAFIKFPSE